MSREFSLKSESLAYVADVSKKAREWNKTASEK